MRQASQPIISMLSTQGRIAHSLNCVAICRRHASQPVEQLTLPPLAGIAAAERGLEEVREALTGQVCRPIASLWRLSARGARVPARRDSDASASLPGSAQLPRGMLTCGCSSPGHILQTHAICPEEELPFVSAEGVPNSGTQEPSRDPTCVGEANGISVLP